MTISYVKKLKLKLKLKRKIAKLEKNSEKEKIRFTKQINGISLHQYETIRPLAKNVIDDADK